MPLPPGRPLVLGHRGSSRDATENTLAAFELALAQGADGVELDVWRCASGEIVVFHDGDAGRLAGLPLRIAAATWAELSRLEIRAHGGSPRGERIPLLREVLRAFPRAVLNVELKSTGFGDPRLALAVARLIEQAGAEGRVIVSSFDHLLLVPFRLAAPRVPVGLLFEAGQRWRLRTELARRVLRPAAFHPDQALATEERVAAWRAQGLGVAVWTVDAPAEVERLCRVGVAALITNVPGETREAVRRATGR